MTDNVATYRFDAVHCSRQNNETHVYAYVVSRRAII